MITKSILFASFGLAAGGLGWNVAGFGECSDVGSTGARCCACPCEEVAVPEIGAGDYVEARNATVWGGACHISSQRDGFGQHAVLAWSFDSGVRVVAALEGTANLEAHEVFRTGEAPDRVSEIWVDAPSDAAAEAAVAHVRSISDLGENAGTHRAPVVFERDGDAFRVAIEGVLEVEGEALADRSCCTMPESRWYSPLSESTGSVVGVASTCRFEGSERLGGWAFEDENSAYVARVGS